MIVKSAGQYTLSFGPNERRIEFRARTATDALALAESLIGPGVEATLLEDGETIGRVRSAAAAPRASPKWTNDSMSIAG